MYTEKKEEKFLNLNILNRKRAKSKSNGKFKNKSRNHARHFHNKRGKHIILPKEDEIKEQKNIENVKLNFRHFFHINWENQVFSKEAQKIGEIIDGQIYWFLINSSYFIEENIEDYIQILKDKYCAKIAVAEYKENMNNTNNNGLNLIENNKNNEEKLNMISFDVNNNKENDFNKSKNIKSIMNFVDYDKKGKYFINAFGYNQGKTNLNIFRNKLKNYIDIVHQINQKKIYNLEQKANIIEENYNNNNKNNNDIYIKWINDNPLLEKNNLSYSIHNNYMNYLFDKEKKNLLKQDIILNNEKLNKLVDKESLEIKEEKEDEDVYLNRCYVCNDGDVNQYPSYFECEQCGLKVHPNCYGIRLKQEPKRWKCDICKELSYENAVNMECILCPNKGGAMKRINVLKNPDILQKMANLNKRENENFSEINTSSSSLIMLNIQNNYLKKTDGFWVHLSCALWNEDIKFGYIDSKLNISFIDEHIIYKYNSLCNICNKDNCGPTIKCKIDNCNFQCHPECARLNNYYLEVGIINKVFIHNLYCHKHHQNRFAKTLNNINKYNIDSIFAFDDALNKLYQSYRLKYRREFYYPQKNEDCLIIEKYINLTESNNNLNENTNHNKKKYYKKKKNKFFTNIKNYQQIKIFEKENPELSEIVDMGKEMKAIILNSSENINNNINTLEYIIDDKNSTNNNNSINSLDINNYHHHDFVKNTISENSHKIYDNNHKNDNQNIIIIEHTQSKSNSSNYINLNNINYNNNISNSDNDMSDTTISHIKPNVEQFLSLEKEIELNKESFIVYLIGFLNNYYKTNRLILFKGDGCYYLSKDEEDNLLNDMYYDDLFSDEFPINEIQYKSLTPNLIKKYLKNIFPNEEAFNNLFINKIDCTLKKLKKNEKYKNKEIICKNMGNCIGKENGKYKLLSVDEFKYQILNDKNIPRFFLCNECLNNNGIEDEDEDEYEYDI